MPSSLEGLLRSLLDRDARRRPETAALVREALDELGSATQRGARTRVGPPGGPTLAPGFEEKQTWSPSVDPVSLRDDDPCAPPDPRSAPEPGAHVRVREAAPPETAALDMEDLPLAAPPTRTVRVPLSRPQRRTPVTHRGGDGLVGLLRPTFTGRIEARDALWGALRAAGGPGPPPSLPAQFGPPRTLFRGVRGAPAATPTLPVHAGVGAHEAAPDRPRWSV